jgi:IS30 family transposase
MGMKTYFCDPYASWQKGSVENTNGRLRRDFPRKINLNAVSKEEIEQINIMHNLTPREKLGYKTPFESLLENLGKKLILTFNNKIALQP